MSNSNRDSDWRAICDSQVTSLKFKDERIAELESLVAEQQAKIDRLCARGIEDMKFEISELKAKHKDLHEKCYGVGGYLPMQNYDRSEIERLKGQIAELMGEMSELVAKVERLSQSTWISMQKDGVQQIFPTEPGQYETYDDGSVDVVTWPIEQHPLYGPYEWMGATHFRKHIPPLSDTEVKT